MPMQPIFNTKPMFYDYFPHIDVMRMKMLFGLGYYEQGVVRNEIQKVIAAAYERLVEIHDLRHFNVYQEIGEEFDDNFYNELKNAVQLHFHDMNNWEFLDALLPKLDIDAEEEYRDFQTKMTAAVGYVSRSMSSGRINFKDALVALLNHDLDPLTGQELLHLTKIK